MNRYLCIVICVLLIIAVSTAQAVEWQKYVSKDKSYSFHHPKGWKVEEQDSIVGVTNPAATDEQLLLISLPAEDGDTPRQVANNAMSLLKQASPDLKASLWREGESSVAFHITMTSEGKPNEGDALVIKQGTSAFWFSYTNLKSAYNDVRSLALVRGFAGSMAEGDGSEPPKTEAAPQKIKRTPEELTKLKKNGNAFIFVLSFGLGTPFTAAQEKVLMDELMDGWAYMSMEELSQFDQYQGLVASIMKVDQSNMGKVRQGIEELIREWLSETDQDDPGVKVVKNQLNASSRILVEGNPPLSEMAATAYAEMMVFSGLLKKNPKATPDQIPASSVAEYKAKITKAWNSLSAESKNDACAMPGVWMTMRQVLRAGTADQQKQIRGSLSKVGGSSQASSSSTSSKSSGSTNGSIKSQLTRNFIAHNTVMMMKQQTFNSYMWSRGYSGWTPMGKIW